MRLVGRPLPGRRYRRTQEACADTVGVDVSTWRVWERGKRCARIQEALLFAEAFGLDEEVVFRAIAQQEHRRNH